MGVWGGIGTFNVTQLLSKKYQMAILLALLSTLVQRLVIGIIRYLIVEYFLQVTHERT